MDFNEAVLAHSKWKTRLKDHINGQAQMDPVAAGKDDQCALGQWIHGEGKKHATLSGFADLKAKHAKFHLAAANVVKSARSCSRDETLKLLDFGSEFSRASSDVVNALNAMKTALIK